MIRWECKKHFPSILSAIGTMFLLSSSVVHAEIGPEARQQLGVTIVPIPVPVRHMNDSTTIIEAKGWNIHFRANFSSKAIISLPDAQNNRVCLESCSLHNETTGCRLVQYNSDTRECVGFTTDVEGTFRSTNMLSVSLLALARKQFSSTVGFHPDGGSFITGTYGEYVANNSVVYGGEAQCVLLCHLHPRCKTTMSFRDSYGPSDGNCMLKTAGTSLVAGDADHFVSYISS